MRKYEYQIIAFDTAKGEEQLNALGAEGWRVVQVLEAGTDDVCVLIERDAGPRFHDIRSAAAHG